MDESTVLLAYRPEGNTSKWLSYLIANEDSYPKLFLLTALLLSIVLPFIPFGPAVETIGPIFMHPIWLLIIGPIALFMSYRAQRYLMQPTHIEIADQGIRTHSKQFGSTTKWIPWKSISAVSIKQLKGSTTQDNAVIAFSNQDGRVVTQVKVGGLIETDGKEKFLKALDKHAKELRRDYEVTALLSRPPEHTYTELWLNALSATPQRERLAPLTPGTLVKGTEYTIVDRIGMGGQGTAYKAMRRVADDRDETVVVLKEYVLPVHVTMQARRNSIETLQNEALLLQKLDHPQVVKLIDFFFEDHRGYLVMELIEGNSLRSIVQKEGPFLESLVRDLALQMCDILEYLHSQSPPVVHRDFTPDNLILTTSGILKLIDFNVAQQRETTTTATVVGKHAFIPPEQFRGRPTPGSDIYAMGGTLHFLLTGADPQPITPAHPQKLNAAITTQMDDLIAHATAVDEKKRTADAAEFRQALRSVGIAV